MTKRILLAGESWVMHTIHQKGFDSFTTTAYGEGHQWLSKALEGADFQVEHLPNHLANDQFPMTAEELSPYSVVILSDIGANTLLLHSATFVKSEKRPNRLESIREYVASGGGQVMVGGYLTFQGIDAKGKYAGTPVETALPVMLQTDDDRVEAPQGVEPVVSDGNHPIVAGLPASWPDLLGYNRLRAKPEATVIAEVDGDPLIAVWEYGKGRAVAFASDCGPHWAPPEFVEWEGYAKLWGQLAGWVTGA